MMVSGGGGGGGGSGSKNRQLGCLWRIADGATPEGAASAVAVLATLAVLSTACGIDVETQPGEVGPRTTDLRVPVPAPEPGYIDLVTPEAVIAPGEDKMLCYHVTNTYGDVAVRGLVATQATNAGHHIALFTSLDPRPSGTLEDCTSPAANANLRWSVLTLGDLPEGSAIHMPAGAPLVVQFHYINASDEPILVRDVVRVHRTEPAAVTRWVATLISTDLDIALPPGRSMRSWDCVVEEERELLAVLGHMHELGARFTIELDQGDGDGMRQIYDVSPWASQLRDAPPVNSYYDQPLLLRRGAVLRTTCEWNNPTTRTVEYPVEMCTLFGYLGGTQQQLQCTPHGALAGA
jgi:hypothetical protein